MLWLETVVTPFTADFKLLDADDVSVAIVFNSLLNLVKGADKSSIISACVAESKSLNQSEALISAIERKILH